MGRVSFLLIALTSLAVARKHKLDLENDGRNIIDLSSFAYNFEGTLNVTFTAFKLNPTDIQNLQSDQDFGNMTCEGNGQIGFVLEKLNSRGAVKYQKEASPMGMPKKCALHEPKKDTTQQTIKMKFCDPAKQTSASELLTLIWTDIKEEAGISLEVKDLYRAADEHEPDQDEEIGKRKRRSGRTIDTDSDTEVIKNGESSVTIQQQQIADWTFRLVWKFSEPAEGLYELTFHNCFNRNREVLHIRTLQMELIEKNGDAHYLSTGEMPLPMVYGFVAFLFFVATFVWLMVLRQKDTTVFKIHYLMLFLVFFKALSVMFHAIDFHFLDNEGETDAWTIIFYVVHLLKGGILIVTLTLIGTGWAFIKYVLSEREKKLFLIVVPLQIFVNIAFIIFKETEEGQKEYTSWSHVMILLDLLCYALILYPVYWSIKHLQQASLTDGKAARNLEKLDLFRHFYIMFVLYIYFTRIVVYIMKITLPPNQTWVANFCDEMATLGFFILTGYKFRPGCNNPYFKVEEEMSEVITKSALTENVKKRDKGEKQKLLDDSEDEEDTILDTNAIA